jgi:hypothetical protein
MMVWRLIRGRAQFGKLRNQDDPQVTKDLRHSFDSWRGLALWCDVTGTGLTRKCREMIPVVQLFRTPYKPPYKNPFS